MYLPPQHQPLMAIEGTKTIHIVDLNMLMHTDICHKKCVNIMKPLCEINSVIKLPEKCF